MEKSSTPILSFATRSYYLLTKPGIIMGNLVTTAGGFALACRSHFDILLFLATMLGLGFVIASACVFNNAIDREHDQKMARTKNRPLATGLISVKNAITFAVILGILGAITLGYLTTIAAAATAVFGFVVYVLLYSFAKYHSIHGTLIGSIAGAVPPVVGYCAVTGNFDLGAIIFFGIIALWQMPHFYAIAIYRMDDYIKASIPVLPVIKGVRVTKIQMLIYVVAFIIASCMLTVTGYTGLIYLGVVILCGIAWLALSIQGFKAENDKKWARKMFILSLIIIMALCISIPF